jgi:AspT/YidE/YbjL antiporter-like protein
VLRIGDRLTVVGEAESCRQAARALGNSVRSLEEPNMFTIFIGVVLGLLLGYIPIALPGISTPVRLGMAGGPIIMGILIGGFGPRLHMVTYVTTSANRLIRSLGLSTYLACLGLDAGPQFLDTVMRPAALAWIGWALLIAVVPVVIFGILAMRGSKLGYSTTAGMLCGVMANPIALEYVNDSIPGDKANVSYAAVYPVAMFVRVLLAQILVMAFFS